MRHLAHHLLVQIENRGSHASGMAYINADGTVGIYKNPTPGSQLSLHELPRNAKTVILHTRYATQGAVEDNRNNHPVVSTDNRIALVHNGVISNDHKLRGGLGIEKMHGEVDSLVIPSIISQYGTDGLKEMSGYAAIAWLDVNSPENLYIARLKNSPVAYTHLEDGTFVMSSTEILLEKALIGAGVGYGGVFALADGRMITVSGGFIEGHVKAPTMSYDSYSYGRYSGATSGGHKAPVTPIRGSEDTTPSTVRFGTRGEEIDDDDEEINVDGYFADLERWRTEQDERDAQISRKAMAMLEPKVGGWTDEEWDEYIAELDEREGYENHNSCTVADSTNSGFYILDESGDVSHYPELADLEGALSWMAKMSRNEWDIFQVDESLNWVNHIMDLGHIEDDGELVSWVDDSSEIDEFESPAVRNLQSVREGAQKLAQLKGA